MNESLVDDRQIDRLVDGELDSQERRETILNLDRDDTGWRRCALAFLEDQAWRQDVPSADEGRVQPVVSGDPSDLPAMREQAPASRSWWLIAATLLAAFVAGVAARDVIPFNDERPGHSVAIDEGAGTAKHVDRIVPQDPGHQPEISFVVNGGGGPDREMRVPVLPREDVDPRWFQSPDAPGSIRDLLRSVGHDLGRGERVWTRVQLEDGSQVAVPLEKWEIVPVSAAAPH
ncbi:MAG: hypothetical protein QGG36_01420 [Pirellulaceae bacterium]|jgi:hypothetical protein|nr:hypothetical protein [Pirellulaceae bacterium]MDP7014438.1 hypothetical protein [Pirellulaceae bacterium]